MSVQNLKSSEVSRGQPEVAVIWAAAVGSATPPNLASKSASPKGLHYAIELDLAYSVVQVPR